jgi:hypothetical protein
MLEIVHDLAPGAVLGFHGGNTTVAFCDAVKAFRIGFDAQIIVDDLSFFGEPYFEDGMVAGCVARAVDAGIVYVSSAGNHAQTHYQGTYVDSGNKLGGVRLGTHQIVAGNTAFDVSVPPKTDAFVILQWSNPFNAAGDDYDLCPVGLNAAQCTALNINRLQNGAGSSPIEVAKLPCGNVIGVCNYSMEVRLIKGVAQTLELYAHKGTLALADRVPGDSVFGHPAVPGAIAVAAIAAADPGNDDVEPFSSRGNSTIAFPAAEIREKPDVAAVDGVKVTGAAGFRTPFFGTSASAPHVAAIAALMLEAAGRANRTPSPAAVRTTLRNTAIDIKKPAVEAGAGRVSAFFATLAAFFLDAQGDHFGHANASCDFNSDGFNDLAVGVPSEDVGTTIDAGAVNVIYGSLAGLAAADDQFWTQDTPNVQGIAEAGDAFGQALVAGDFNHDGFCDLAIGVPGEDVGTIVDAGSVNILYGTPKGLSAANNQVWDQNKAGVEGWCEAGDRYGAALSSGDFNSDGFAELAIGVPGEDVGAVVDAGGVNVLYGSVTRLTANGDQLWHQNVSSIEDLAETGDHFGSALTTGDFNGDGFADLAIGIPEEDVGRVVDAGAVSALYGTQRGLTTVDDQLWSQNSSGVEGTAGALDRFGAALASGDFDGDGFADLAIGVPNEDVGAIVEAGAVNVLYGTRNRLSSLGDQVWDQNKSNVLDLSETGDRFGSSLSTGDFNHDGFADLTIGIPNEDLGVLVDAGAVQVLYGAPLSLSANGNQFWTQNSSGVEDVAEADDHFGTSSATGDFNGDGFIDLAIGIPDEDVGLIVDAGAVQAFYGTAGGISSAGDQIWTQNSSGIEDISE